MQSYNGPNKSLINQVKECKKFSESCGYSVAGVFQDVRQDANNIKRPGLSNLIAKCQEEKDISAIIVQGMDRLVRNFEDYINLRISLAKVGTKIISIGQLMGDDETPESKMIDLIIASVGHYQSKVHGQKISAGIRAAKIAREGAK